jgi:hypothetical protein
MSASVSNIFSYSQSLSNQTSVSHTQNRNPARYTISSTVALDINVQRGNYYRPENAIRQIARWTRTRIKKTMQQNT